MSHFGIFYEPLLRRPKKKNHSFLNDWKMNDWDWSLALQKNSKRTPVERGKRKDHKKTTCFQFFLYILLYFAITQYRLYNVFTANLHRLGRTKQKKRNKYVSSTIKHKNLQKVKKDWVLSYVKIPLFFAASTCCWLVGWDQHFHEKMCPIQKIT